MVFLYNLMASRYMRFGVVCIAALSALFIFQNCSAPQSQVGNADSSGSSNSSATVGLDYSGTWALNRLDCYDSTMTKVVNTAAFDNLSETLTIAGNQLKRTITQNSCAVVANLGVVFQTSFVRVTNEVVASASGGNCVVNYSLSSSQVTPMTSAVTYATSEKVLPAERGFFYFASVKGGIQELALIGDYSDTQRNYCMKVYRKN
jgi:hypothetical protein